MSPAVRRLLALLCLAGCGGFLFGINYEKPAPRETRSENESSVSATRLDRGIGLPSVDLQGPAGTSGFTNTAARAMSAGDYTEALGYYRAALSDAKTKRERILLADKLLGLGRAAHQQDKTRGTVAIAAFEEAVAVYKTINGTEDKQASTWMDLADAAAIRGDTEREERAWREALSVAEKAEAPALQANVHHRAGAHYSGKGQFAKARVCLDAALAYFRQVNDKRLIAHTLRYYGGLELDAGHYFRARTHLTQAAVLLEQVGEAETRAAVLGTIGDVDLAEGKLREARIHYEEGLSVWRRVRQPFWTARFIARLAQVEVAQGNLTQAKLLAERSLKLFQDSNGPVARAYPLMVLGDVARLQGHRSQAIRYHEEAARYFEQTGNPVRRMRAYYAIANDYGTDVAGQKQKAIWKQRAQAILAKTDRAR